MLDKNQYLELDFMKEILVSGVATSGRISSNEWVTSFRIEILNNTIGRFVNFSSDGKTIFEGNYDSSSVVKHIFAEPVKTSKLRVVPVRWNDWLSMRVAAFGCNSIKDGVFQLKNCFENNTQIRCFCRNGLFTSKRIFRRFEFYNWH